MNKLFASYIETNRSVLEAADHPWELSTNLNGKAIAGCAWNLTKMVGGVRSPTHYLSHLGTDSATLSQLGDHGKNAKQVTESTLSAPWQDLIKAAVVDQLFIRHNSTGHVVLSIVRPIRVLATCCAGKEPWQINADDVVTAFNVAKNIQASGKLADLIAGLVKVLFDQNHLADAGPLYPALAMVRMSPGVQRKAKFVQSSDRIRETLEDRKRADRLPSSRAFWELVRIVMTEQPRTFVDELRFAALRIMLVTGFRIGEVVMLPLDWRRERTHLTPSGRKPSTLGGVDRSLSIRHFAEKQNTDGGSSLNLREATHHVPRMFEDIVDETLEKVAAITSPIRATLKAQSLSGRIFSSFRERQLVPILHLLPFISGNPFWLEFGEEERSLWINRCRSDPSGRAFNELFDFQVSELRSGSRNPSNTAYVYFNRMKHLGQASGRLSIRNAGGDPIGVGDRMRWRECFLRIDEVEAYMREEKKTKLSDIEPLQVDGRPLATAELLFIHPKRSLAEERSDGICDITRYACINRPSTEMLLVAVGEYGANETIFERYGRTDEDRRLMLRSHSLRHLQNTELFRLGVADSIITKRFNRSSIVQSHEYDHRTLSEDLDAVELPSDVEFSAGEKTATVYKMIKAGKASGPIVDDFRRIQQDEGEEAALEFLRAEADGFHATPYGTCVSSFTVSPCPKHLQCFDGCRNLTASERPEVRRNLLNLEIKLIAAAEDTSKREAKTAGAENQIRHAETMLGGVRRLLATPPGKQVFPGGPDFSNPDVGG